MYANEKAIVRNHTTADNATIKSFSDCHRVNLDWDDGAMVYIIYDTLEEAVTHLNNLGFYSGPLAS